MGFNRHTAAGVRDDRDVPALASSLDRRHCHADLREQTGDDQLLAAGLLDRVDDLPVFPGVDEHPVDHFLAGKDVGDLREDEPTPVGQHAREDGRDAKCLGGFRQARSIVDRHMRVVTVQVGELIRLVVDQDENGVFRAKKRI